MAKRKLSAKQKAALAKGRAALARKRAGRSRKSGGKKSAPKRTGKARRPRQNPIPPAFFVNPDGGVFANSEGNMAKTKKRGKSKSKPKQSHTHDTTHRRRKKRHNPIGSGIKGLGITVAKGAATAAAIGGLGNFLEAKLLGSRGPFVRALARGAAAIGTGLLLRKHPVAALTGMGALLGPIGGEQGTKLGGGMIAFSKSVGAKKLAEMAADDADMAILLKEELSEFGMDLNTKQIGEGGDMDGDGDDMGAGDGADLDGEEDAA